VLVVMMVVAAAAALISTAALGMPSLGGDKVLPRPDAAQIGMATKLWSDRAAPGYDQPAPPVNVFGQTFDAGGNPIICDNITIRNLRTGSVNYTATSSDPVEQANGYYEFDLNTMAGGWQDGDVINVTAVNTTLQLMGQNEGVILASLQFLYLNIDVVTVIPEFPMVIVPVLGMVVVVAVLRFAGREREG